MGYTDLVRKHRKAVDAEAKLRQMLIDYPAAGDLYKHRTEDKKFKKLTQKEWDSIERYNVWSYYEVIKDKQ